MTPSPYNEDNYLDGNPIYIRYFEASYRANLKKWQEEQEEFSSVLENYDELVTKIALFIKHLGYTSSIDCSMTLSYLINCGFLSHDMAFESEPPKTGQEIDYSLGTNIVIGNGCCRNFTQMHLDVFQKLGIPLQKFYCYEGINPFNRAKNANANHVISLIEFADNLYGIDIYNSDRLFHFRDSFTMTSISMNYTNHLRYKPYYEITHEGATLEDILAILEKFGEYSKKRSINPFDYCDHIKFETGRRLRRLEDEMMDFHEETKTLKKDIHDEMKEILARR